MPNNYIKTSVPEFGARRRANTPRTLFDRLVCRRVVTKSSGYTVAFAVALPIEPENAWTRGGSVLVIVIEE